jgi:hypothetical protein
MFFTFVPYFESVENYADINEGEKFWDWQMMH